MWGLTANRPSRGLSVHSTDRYAGGLNFRVRDETGCFPTAMAVKRPGLSQVGYISFSFVPARTSLATWAIFDHFFPS